MHLSKLYDLHISVNNAWRWHENNIVSLRPVLPDIHAALHATAAVIVVSSNREDSEWAKYNSHDAISDIELKLVL